MVYYFSLIQKDIDVSFLAVIEHYIPRNGNYFELCKKLHFHGTRLQSVQHYGMRRNASHA